MGNNEKELLIWFDTSSPIVISLLSSKINLGCLCKKIGHANSSIPFKLNNAMQIACTSILRLEKNVVSSSELGPSTDHNLDHLIRDATYTKGRCARYKLFWRACR
jgi:hypothetical protein